MERIGIIDLGSNSARLVIVDIFADGYFMVTDELQEVVRLGQDMERDGFLKPQRVAETIKTLRMFKKLCDSSNVDKIVAFATAAVRRAKNQRSFLDEIQATCGIKVRVLLDDEEAMYTYRGIINTMDVPKGIIFEISGGSTKIIYYNRRNLLNFVTLPFGAVTLTDLFRSEDVSPEDMCNKIEEFFTEQLRQVGFLDEIDPETQMIGVGGTFRNIFRMFKMVSKYPLDGPHNYHMPIDDFIGIYDMIRVLDIDKTKKIKGLSMHRADILPAALAVIRAFTKYINAESFNISNFGIREGVMLSIAQPMTVEKPISDVLTYSLNSLVKYYDCDEAHVNQVVMLSVQLFKQLRVLHKFSRQYLKILRVAATLHDIGKSVRFFNCYKHSAYMMLNANLYGLSHKETVLAAFVVEAHSNDDINTAEWLRYRSIVSDEDLDAVRKLGVILRIAESLDRCKNGVVKNVNCDVLGDSVIMKTEVDGDAGLEIRDALKANPEFKRSFRKNLEIL